MAWHMAGQWLETCSCKMICRCTMGPAEPDQGWCSAAILLDIQQGDSDGVNLGNTRAVWVIDLPGDFAAGNGTARVYLDERASSHQRGELEAILTGKKGGLWAGLAGLVSEWRPSRTTRIEVQWGDNPSATVGDVGHIQVQPIKDEGGNRAQLLNAPANYGVAETFDLARADGTRWSDPEMRGWQSLGYGTLTSFRWSV